MATVTMSDIVRGTLVNEGITDWFKRSDPRTRTQKVKDKAAHIWDNTKSAYGHGRAGVQMAPDSPTYTKVANAAGRAEKHVRDNKWKYAAGAGAAAAAAGGAYAYHKHKQANSGIKGFAKRNGKAIAATSLGAIGAGVGVKALMKYLRKKKKQG